MPHGRWRRLPDRSESRFSAPSREAGLFGAGRPRFDKFSRAIPADQGMRRHVDTTFQEGPKPASTARNSWAGRANGLIIPKHLFEPYKGIIHARNRQTSTQRGPAFTLQGPVFHRQERVSFA